ncbi:MAG: hypothetical protein QG670_1503 [Thermoproteota archaeon]|nr:hypothetical protein [Thermoproteota archaeon]
MVTLICMVGNDYQRIIDGISFWKENEQIEAIYLLFDEKKDKYGFASQINANDLSKFLSSTYTNTLIVGFNPQSYENVFSTLYRILEKEVEGRKREVLIDSTSTTKEAYGATVTISLMFIKVRIYIVPPQERGWYVPSPEDQNFKDWFSRTRNIPGSSPQEIYLPGQRFERPIDEEKTILLKLSEHEGKSETLGLIIKWLGEDSLDPIIKNHFSRIVSRLEGKGFVEKRQSTKGKEIHLTYFGKIFADAISIHKKKSTQKKKKNLIR